MEIGIYKKTDEKEFKKEIENGSLIGIEADSLLNEINQLEIANKYNLVEVLAQIKLELMLILGKAIIPTEEKKGEN